MKKFKEIIETIWDWLPVIIFFTVLTAFCILTHSWILLSIIILFVPLFIWFMSWTIEASLREHFSFDYLMHLETECDFFEAQGYEIVRHLDPGTSYPGVLMAKKGAEDVEIRLVAPLSPSKFYVEVITTASQQRVRYSVRDSAEQKIANIEKLILTSSKMDLDPDS